MASIPELAAQVDSELSKDFPNTDHLLTFLQQITNQVSTPEGCEDLNDLILDLVPIFVQAAGKSKACENAVEHLLEAATQKCVAREVYSALGAALAGSMQNIAIDQSNALGASSLKFQSFLLDKLTSSLLRIKRLSPCFLREHLLLATDWCFCAQQEEDGYQGQNSDIPIGEDGFCNAIGPCIEVVAWREDFTVQERKSAQQILCCSILKVTASSLELPSRLENAAEAAQSTLLEAQSTLSGKLYKFQTLLMELLRGPEIILSLFTKASPEFGIRDLEDLLNITYKDTEPEDEALGAAAAVCSSILRTSLSSSVASAISAAYVTCSVLTGKMLQYVSMALNTLTDAAAQHHSIPLALLPLLTISQFAHQLGVNETPLEESYVSLTLPIISTLVAVMSLNPVEIVRTCAYEALHSFLDGMAPQARFLVLQNMTSVSSTNSTVIAALGLQRLRLEISPAVLQAPFTHTTALQLALPWIKQSAQPPGWETEEDVLRNADVLTAALSVLRFILLQRVAMVRKIVGGEDGQKQQGRDLDDSAGRVPLELQLERFQILLTEHLRPLQTCVGNLIRRVKSSSFTRDNNSNEINGQLEVFLALQRLEEVLERILEAANELLKSA
ncbi:hypothetical protein NADE_006879 [Nannochloris sp. 'desiccata']|nr:hypothetical protein NADE_006879 [Chlorella desiccata (nom. nud.)]